MGRIMGFIKDAKSSALANEAQKAKENGQTTFVATLNMPTTRHGLSGEVADWSQMIDAVNAKGWRLLNATGMQDHKGKPQLVAVWVL